MAKHRIHSMHISLLLDINDIFSLSAIGSHKSTGRVLKRPVTANK